MRLIISVVLNLAENFVQDQVIKRDNVEIKIVDGHLRARVRKISPLHTMYERGIIDVAQFSAGVKLHQSYVVGWHGYNNCEVRERVDGGGKIPEMTATQVQALNDYAKGMKAAKTEVRLIQQVVINELPLTQRGMSGGLIKQLRKRFNSTLHNMAKAYGYV